MEYSKVFKNTISILKLDREAMVRVAGDKSATYVGLGIFVIPAVVNLILAASTFSSGFGVMFSRFLLWPMLIPALSSVGCIFLMSYCAVRIFGGKGDHMGFFRVVSYSGIVLWVTMIPYFLGLFGMDPIGLANLILLVGSVWIMVTAYQMLIHHHRISQQDTVAVVVAGVIGYFLLRYFLADLLVGSAYRFF